jgi:hypothetical protein
MAEAAAVDQAGHMRRFTLLTFFLVVIAFAPIAATTRASGAILPNCGSTSAVFQPWSDFSPYYFAPNGGFENGTAGWSLAGQATLMTTNDPYKLSGAGSHALRLGTGASASTSVCYGLTYPAIRFVGAGVNGPAVVHVRIVSQSLLGVLSTLDGGTFTIPSGWAPAPKLSTLFSAVAAPLGTTKMQIKISVESGTADIDDLYVDPLFTKA